MNFIKKYAVLLAGLAYLIIGAIWVIYMFGSDWQAEFPGWSFLYVIYFILMAVMWPGSIIYFLESGRVELIIMGVIGLIALLLIIAPCLLFIIRSVRKKFTKAIN